MPYKSKAKKTAPVRPAQIAPINRELPMPKYDYQTPKTDSFVVRYEDQKERQERAGKEKAPTLQNLKFADA
jgi:hypothetical protein